MSTLTEFLLQRLAEDERHARKLAAADQRPILSLAITVNHPQRLLAEVEAKRRAIEAAWDDHVRIESEWGSGQSRAQMSAKDDNPVVVECLALPFADHPDYQEAWKP